MNNVSLSTALHYALSRGRGGIHYSGFADSGSEASSAPHRLVCTIHQLSLTAVRIAYYSSSQPLELRFNPRLLGLGRRTFPGHLGQKSDEPFCRTEQGVPGKDNK